MTVRRTSRARVALTDAELMMRASDGDVHAFGDLYDRYCDRAYRVARSVCDGDAYAEDAVQEAFLAIWRTRASYHSQRGTVAAWVLSAVRNSAIDVARRNCRPVTDVASNSNPDTRRRTDDTAQAIRQGDQGEQLRMLLSRLPDAQREVITLAFYGRLTHSEIAEHLGLPPESVKGRMRLGLEKLVAARTPHP